MKFSLPLAACLNQSRRITKFFFNRERKMSGIEICVKKTIDHRTSSFGKKNNSSLNHSIFQISVSFFVKWIIHAGSIQINRWSSKCCPKHFDELVDLHCRAETMEIRMQKRENDTTGNRSLLIWTASAWWTAPCPGKLPPYVTALLRSFRRLLSFARSGDPRERSRERGGGRI